MDTITDEYMRSRVLNHGELLQQFPFLVPVKTAVEALGTCLQCQAKAKGIAARTALNQARRTIGMMSDADKLRFKRLLNAASMRVQWTEAIGGSNKRVIKDF